MPHAHGSTLKGLVRMGRTADACWTWLGSVNEEGVAVKQFDGKNMPARRWVWMQFFGPITPGFVITNSCQNNQCVNPWHLRMCTQAEANRAGVQTILLPADVIEIRSHKKFKSAAMAEALADRCGCSKQTVYDIWRGSTWSRGASNFGPNRKAA